MTGSVSVLPTLWFGAASSTPTELKVREGEQVLGRAADADLCVSETFVSTYHARLNWQRGQLKVLDLSSTNGTMVNGVPVVGWTTLTDGDVIEFGGVEAVVRLPSVIDLTSPSDSFPPPPQHGNRPTGEVPALDRRPVTEPPPVVQMTADDMPPIGGQLPDDVATAPTGKPPVTLPPTPPTGITITDIEAVTEGYGDFDMGVFGADPGYDGPFGAHPESVRGRRRRGGGRRTSESGPRANAYDRPSPAFSREGVSPIVIIVAVALLVVIILAALFLA